jgi:HEAT repeat protein
MRSAVLAAFAGWALFFLGGPAPAQTRVPPFGKKAGKKAAADKAAPEVKEVGGKTLTQWAKEINARDPSRRENAIRTVLMFGPERAAKAVPTLLAGLSQDTAENPIDLSVRTTAVIALSDILANVRQPDPKQLKRALTYLLRKLRFDSQEVVRYRATQAVGQLAGAVDHLGREAPAVRSQVLSQLLYTVKTPDNWEIRQAAAVALSRWVVPPSARGKESKMTPAERRDLDKVVLELTNRARRDSSFQVRLTCLHSIRTLGQLAGTPVRVAVERDLVHIAANDPEPTVHVWAHVALLAYAKAFAKKVDPKRVAAVGKLLTTSKDLAVRLQAAQALATIGPDADSQIPRLVQALADSDKAVVGASLLALTQLGEKGHEELGKLLVGAKDPAIRVRAVELLGTLGTKAKAQLPRVARATKDADKNVAFASILALAHMGETGVEQVGRMLAQEKDVQTRIRAAEALGSAGPAAKSQVPVLVAALGDANKNLVGASAWALAHVGKAAYQAVPELQKVARGKDCPEAVRQTARAAIDAIEGRTPSSPMPDKPAALPGTR